MSLDSTDSAAHVPDVVAPSLRILFCGINPGRRSGAVGHHFAHPGNRFWKALALAGLTDRQYSPGEEQLLLGHGLGITNLVERTTATASELSRDELKRGAASLGHKVRALGPSAVAFLGLGAYRIAFGRPRAPLGRQPELLGGAIVWVVANPSGLQARYGVEEIAGQLREIVADCARRGSIGSSS
ncbi:MAG: G/U mismatch-specific DNA glycosylase [Acidimicrobiales bacterium]